MMKQGAVIEWIKAGITPKWVEGIPSMPPDFWANSRGYMQSPAGTLPVIVVAALAERWGIK